MSQLIGPKSKTITLFLLFLNGCSSEKPTINIAVASNFEPVLNQLIESYINKSSDVTEINIIAGSSGLLANQILNGAPFDLFLSADDVKPEVLYKYFNNLNYYPEIYAIGQLTLWIPNGNSNKPCIEQLERLDSVAIANPEIAPYGLKAKQVLNKYLSKTLNIINTSNVNQAYFYTRDSITEAGFVSYSSLILNKSINGCMQFFNNYQLNQTMLLIHNKAQPIYNYILSKESKKIIVESGYNIIKTK